MKYAARLLVIVVALLICPASWAEDVGCTSVPKAVNKFISNYAAKVYGAEYCKFRHVTHGDINGDGKNDTIVAFNIEGACFERDTETRPGACGNHFEGYMFAWLSGPVEKPTKLLEFGSGWRYGGVERLQVKGSIVVVSMLKYGGDAQCCPSKHVNQKFRLQGRRFVDTYNKAFNATARKRAAR